MAGRCGHADLFAGSPANKAQRTPKGKREPRRRDGVRMRRRRSNVRTTQERPDRGRTVRPGTGKRRRLLFTRTATASRMDRQHGTGRPPALWVPLLVVAGLAAGRSVTAPSRKGRAGLDAHRGKQRREDPRMPFRRARKAVDERRQERPATREGVVVRHRYSGALLLFHAHCFIGYCLCFVAPPESAPGWPRDKTYYRQRILQAGRAECRFR